MRGARGNLLPRTRSTYVPFEKWILSARRSWCGGRAGVLLLQKEAHLISEPRDNKFTQDYARFFKQHCLPACHAKVWYTRAIFTASWLHMFFFIARSLSLSHILFGAGIKSGRATRKGRERREIIIKQQQQKSFRGKLAKNACVRYLRLTCNLPWRVVLKSGCLSQKGMRLVLFLGISQRHSWKPASATHF